MSTCLAIVTDMITTTFIYPVFSAHLLSKFGLSIEVSSVFFVISMGSYFLTLQFLNKISNKVGVKLTICIGLLINFLFVPFLAPASFLPQSLVTIILGLIIVGMTGACVTVPGIIDFMDTMKTKMKIDEMAANDVSSALYNLSINTGEAIGPIVGGSLTSLYSFETACYSTGFLCLTYATLYAFYNLNTIKQQLVSPKVQETETTYDDEYKDIKRTIGIGTRRESIDTYSYFTRYRAFSFSQIAGSKRPSMSYTEFP